MSKIGRKRDPPSLARRKILVLHGPNLNLLGTREPEIYGRDTLGNIDARLTATARKQGIALESFQSNQEGALIERVHAAKRQGFAWIIVNPGGLTHTSIALRDAFASVAIPFLEVHLSNIYSREPFRRHSYFSDLAVGTVCGLGSRSYDLALEFVLQSSRSIASG
ncbi:MAG TPA: type II 3-dehydroquinate dehydratase [Burkholderiales bacterium]|nr:type II 3-dehydroquinate dehydratase [Burkholderiales bacterium]